MTGPNERHDEPPSTSNASNASDAEPPVDAEESVRSMLRGW